MTKDWSIAVKTVGLQEKAADFTVQVSPEDQLTTLIEKIKGITGLDADQQRLIYRGRIISTYGKVKDVMGLQDGHTIHLVKKKQPPPPPPESPTTALQTASEASSVSPTASLGSLTENRRSWRRTRRRNNYRLSAEDVAVSDPGSMESVRQGLLTLHTMIPLAQQQAERRQSPLDLNRQFYAGQWIDARDTVNEWLEATIVEIVDPEDILPPFEDEEVTVEGRRARPTITPASDPPVHATDFDGRLRLLLEPCHESDPRSLGGDLAGLRRRDSNDGVQIILIHYNGWPHRWDEWIRSDSERLRPFRVRTRHPNNSSNVAPTPMSDFLEAPSTHIVSEDEAQDRYALLTELARVTSRVTSMLEDQALRFQNSSRAPSTEDQGDRILPWETNTSGSGDTSDSESTEDDPPRESVRPSVTRRELEALAPLLDRLGRTLTDAAPHVAVLAASVDDEECYEEHRESTGTLGGLLSMLRDRRRRSLTSTSTNVVVPEDNTVSDRTTGTSESSVVVDPDYTDFASGIVNTTRGEVRAGPRSTRRVASDDLSSLLGAYLAASSLSSILIGDDADTSALTRLLRDRGLGGPGIDIHIHAVVTSPNGGGTGTAPTLGFTALDGSPLGGIDRQGETIEAEVVPDSPRRNRLNFSRPRSDINTMRSQEDEDEDLGIFSELYSENPNPVNPSVDRPANAENESSTHGEHQSSRGNRSARPRSAEGGRRSVLGRFFGRSSSRHERG